MIILFYCINFFIIHEKSLLASKNEDCYSHSQQPIR